MIRFTHREERYDLRGVDGEIPDWDGEIAGYIQCTICSDCVSFIARGDTPQELDDDQTEEWLESLADGEWTVGDREEEFSIDSCDHCGVAGHGYRSNAYLKEAK